MMWWVLRDGKPIVSVQKRKQALRLCYEMALRVDGSYVAERHPDDYFTPLATQVREDTRAQIAENARWYDPQALLAYAEQRGFSGGDVRRLLERSEAGVRA